MVQYQFATIHFIDFANKNRFTVINYLGTDFQHIVFKSESFKSSKNVLEHFQTILCQYFVNSANSKTLYFCKL